MRTLTKAESRSKKAQYLRLQTKLYDMKRDWLLFAAEAEVCGDLEEAKEFRAQLQKICFLLESIGADSSKDPPRRTDA